MPGLGSEPRGLSLGHLSLGHTVPGPLSMVNENVLSAVQ